MWRSASVMILEPEEYDFDPFKNIVSPFKDWWLVDFEEGSERWSLINFKNQEIYDSGRQEMYCFEDYRPD